MAIRNIVKDGDEILTKVCRPVEKFDEKLGVLLDDMIETMKSADGVGLAAPQVGIRRRVVVIDVGSGPIEMVNPEIVEQSGEQECVEGCLSFPGHNGAIERPRKVKIRAQDRHGETFEMEAEEMLARCFCHETNHLDGITIMDLADHFYEDDYPDEAEED